MPCPQNWDAIFEKLKELYPDEVERGRLWKKLWDIDQAKAFNYLRDTDTAVKTVLDDFLREGIGGAGASNPHGSPPGRLLDSDDPMYKFVQALPEVRPQVLTPKPDSVITLSCNWMGDKTTFSRHLYVRRCYGELLESSALYKERRDYLEGILIAGTPGIGKSHMAGLVVAQLLLSGRVVLLELAHQNSAAGSGARSFFRMQLKADGEASVVKVATHLDADQWLRYEHRAVKYDKAKAPAYVVDGGLPSLAFGRFPNEGHCFWQFCSAQPGILREINKGAAYKAFYPPLFTLPELLHLKANVTEFAGLSDDQVRDAYAIMGGIARPVLFLQARGDKSLADLRNDVKAKIGNMGKTGWKALYDTLEGDKGFHDGSDMIVHWDALEASSTPQPRKPNSPEEDSMRRYTRHRAQLASPYVAALLSIRMGLAAAERCAMFAVSHGTRGCAAGMVGRMHESLSHIFLAGGGDFECRMIDSGKEFILKLLKSRDVEMFQSTADAVTLATAPDASCYLMPASATYPAIDSLKTLAMLFQMAAGKTPDINRPGMYELVQAFDQDQMEAALQDLRGMTGLTEQDLPGRMPVTFFATMPESYDNGFRSLQKYVASGASIIAEVAKELQQLAGPAADMDEG